MCSVRDTTWATRAEVRPAQHVVAPVARSYRELGTTSAGSDDGSRLGTALRALDLVAVAAAIVLVHELGGGPLTASIAFGVSVLALCAARRVPISLRVHDQLGHLALGAAAPAALLVPWLGASVAWRLALATILMLAGVRTVAYATIRSLRRHGRLLEPALIVGVDTTGRLLARLLGEHPELGLVPLGFVDALVPEEPALPVLGPVTQLRQVVVATGARRVLVASPVEPDVDLVGELRACRALGVDVCVVPRFHEVGTVVARRELDEAFGVPLVPLRALPSGVACAVKRTFDVVVASALLVMLAPLLLVLGVLVRLQSGRSPLFRQRRVTRVDRVAEIYKLRTLPPHQHPDTTWAVPEDGMTRLGRWLRVMHLDELAQLANVVRGDMALVGPRPERPHFVARFSEEIPGYEERLRVPAGITGLSQVMGLTGDTSIAERVRLDTRYVETWSLWLDVTILVRTVARGVASISGATR
jgi:exopolysaccharide biosynthesis polyprenyl glycosylphosphotransferase